MKGIAMRSSTHQEPRLVLDLGVEEAEAMARVLRAGLKEVGDGSDKEHATAVGIAIKQFTDANKTASSS
jgi:hypothetical protein